jgi:hypothetical protein
LQNREKVGWKEFGGETKEGMSGGGGGGEVGSHTNALGALAREEKSGGFHLNGILARPS